MAQNKKWHNPLYKRICKLRENVQNRRKVFKFKTNKWRRLLSYLKRQTRFFKRGKSRDHTKFKLHRFASFGNSMKKKYRNSMQAGKKFNLFYGGFSKKYLKKKILLTLKKNKQTPPQSSPKKNILKYFESRLDTVLYRAHFSKSIKNAQQLISHKHVIVNNNIIKRKNYPLKKGDIIEINIKSRKLIKNNLRNTNFWPIPPNYLTINYKTLQIVFGNIEKTNFYRGFPFWLDLNSVIFHYHRH
jgi:ribosomal protein S4